MKIGTLVRLRLWTGDFDKGHGIGVVVGLGVGEVANTNFRTPSQRFRLVSFPKLDATPKWREARLLEVIA